MELRGSIKKMLNIDRFMTVNNDQIFIVRGSHMGIFVASRVISPSNGGILVEWFMLPPANAAFYTTPHHQYPQPFL